MNATAQTEACIVRLAEDGGQGRIGTGFLVAPGYVLTCAHVVEPPSGTEQRQFVVESRYRTWQCLPEQRRPGGQADLALIGIPWTDHPCVLMGAAAEPTHPVWTQGFIRKQGEIRLEPAIGEIEGERRARLDIGGPEYSLVKFKGGQITPGMSGSPLLNLRTSAICGIVAKTLNEATDAGGLAVPVRTILAGYPAIGELQAAYHKVKNDWRLSGLVMPAPELSEREKIDILRTFPPGPGGLLPVISPDIISLFYGLTSADSSAIILAANYLRTRVDPNVKPNLITLNNLPTSGYGPVDFWMAAFTHASGRGPRMVAALLYEALPNTFDSVQEKLQELLATLRTWPIN
jgi:hypothetical protein